MRSTRCASLSSCSPSHASRAARIAASGVSPPVNRNSGLSANVLYSSGAGPAERDPLFRQAAEVCIQNQLGSTSLLQRRLKIGYGRAARLIDFMAEDGIVVAYNGSQAREVLLTLEQWETMRGKQPAAAGAVHDLHR